jgi:hypothetical protein
MTTRVKLILSRRHVPSPKKMPSPSGSADRIPWPPLAHLVNPLPVMRNVCVSRLSSMEITRHWENLLGAESPQATTPTLASTRVAAGPAPLAAVVDATRTGTGDKAGNKDEGQRELHGCCWN